MALVSQSFPNFSFSTIDYSYSFSPKPYFLFGGYQRFELLSLCSNPQSSSPTSSFSSSFSSSSIFLPFLEEEEEIERLLLENEQELQQNKECLDDPIYKFFKSRTSTKDPPKESKISLQRNCRTSWHLARDMDSVEEIAPKIELEVNGKEIVEEIKMGLDENSQVVSNVEEILCIARNLDENSTLGEHLGLFEGRVGEKDCIKVLGLMIEKGMMMCCLYFYEWMGLQEPCLVTPRACTLLFPALGKAGMGDKILSSGRYNFASVVIAIKTVLQYFITIS